jgi:hypothetical protein
MLLGLSNQEEIGGLVARTGEMRNAYKIWAGNLKGRDHLEVLGVDGKILLEWILGKHDGKVWTGFIWLWIGTSGGRDLVNVVMNLGVS